MRQFELLYEGAVLHDNPADFRHFPGGIENGFDGLLEAGRKRRP
jgi:hypothetical protein